MPCGRKTSILSFLTLGQEEGERVVLALNGGKGGPLPQAQNVQKLLGSQNCWGHPPDVPISCSRFGPDLDTADRSILKKVSFELEMNLYSFAVRPFFCICLVGLFGLKFGSSLTFPCFSVLVSLHC